MGGTTSKESPSGGSESRGGVQHVTTNTPAAESDLGKQDSTSTSADNVCGVLDLLSQSKRSAALKAHCCHAHAQHASAAHRRWHPLSEKMRDAALPCPSGADGILSEGCAIKR